MTPSVAIVILNWNGKLWLEKFLPTVIQTEYENLQIIVGDNHSNDHSVAFLKTHYPQITVIETGQNFGFAGGYNFVLQQVQADYFVLLNSDVEVPKNWIQPVIHLMQSDDKIAVAQPKIKWQKDKTQFEYAGAAGGYLDAYGFPFCRGRIFNTLEPDSQQYEVAEDIFWASGASLFIKSKYWQLVNGLDADLFAHMEEIDLCWRLKNLGLKVVYCPQAEIYHVGGGTLDATSPFKTYLNFRNNLIIMQKNLPIREVYLKIFIRMWFDLFAWFMFLWRRKFKFAWAINKAHTHFLLHLFATGKKRIIKPLPYQKHKGVYRHSIVIAYFMKRKKRFGEL